MQVTTKHIKKEEILCMKSPPPRGGACNGGFSDSTPISGATFSNNMSITQARVNMSVAECETTFETSSLLTSRINPISPSLGKTFGFIVFRLLENAFVKLSLPLHNAIISPPCRATPHNFAPKSLSPKKSFFWRKVLPYFRGGDGDYIKKECL